MGRHPLSFSLVVDLKTYRMYQSAQGPNIMSNLDQRRYAPAFQRNCLPILAVLEQALPNQGVVLEIASGTGEHAAFFAQHFPQLTWLPSDLAPPQLTSIAAWRNHMGLDNLYGPMMIDVLQPQWPERVVHTLAQYGDGNTEVMAIVNLNMLHIAPWSATEGLMEGAAELLSSQGILYLYGPFIQGDQPTAPSNLAFDQSLKHRNPAWGIRRLEDVNHLAAQQGLRLENTVAMPAHNLSVIWRRSG